MASTVAFAQDSGSHGAHSVPFASQGNVVELAVESPQGEPTASFVVRPAEAPAWVRFRASSVEATRFNPGSPDTATPQTGEPVAFLTFDVDRTAPVGQPADVVFEVRLGGAVVAEHTVRLVVEAPAELSLSAPYPNPARGAVTVPFEVPEAGRVRLAAYDVLGREVAVLSDGEREAGAHEARIEAGTLAAGVYVLRLDAGAAADVRQLTVVR